jgi:putative PIN family toxin of toxin-antitoxin system
MRVVLDTNILVSGLISSAGYPAAIYDAWEDGKFVLLSCSEHLAELRATLRKPRIADLIKPYKSGRLVNQIKRLAEDIGPLPRVSRSPDPSDDFLLALSEAGKADYLVTGDKSGLLSLRRHKSTKIVSASDFAALLARMN